MYEPVIGLEIHIQPTTVSKMFCGCSANIWQKLPNEVTCPTCLGLPGALPVPNIEAVKKCQLMGLVLNCNLALESKFDRKHYFYPDLPKGYQISQYDEPLCYKGFLEVETEEFGKRNIAIRRVHIEEDTGKSFHTKDGTLLDFNKSGMPLLEIVTEPDLKSGQEVYDFAKKVREIALAFKISQADMEKGQMRIEPSISLRRVGDKALPNYKVELKNINSFKFAKDAISCEIKRQKEVLQKGESLKNQTRGYLPSKKETFEMRTKEEEKDYRYFPEPDIPPMVFNNEWIMQINSLYQEHSKGSLDSFIKKYKLDKLQAKILFENSGKKEYFELSVLQGVSPLSASKVIINLANIPKENPREFFKKYNAVVNTSYDKDKILKIINNVILENEEAVLDFRKGKQGALNFLFGKCMLVLKGQIPPEELLSLVKKSLT